ncbi:MULTISPECIES: branched-chain amino acid ABC transporter substrate-binding protein [Methylobacterium]|uniref:branched-chain amino acid ABC transporter substrate-binding protein n=1 Tax=Methylobacterium TaxID=407 RepID=UPI00104E306A|nr:MULTISPECIES: branched-chain amino acid ABC transporter substrate-binding protein [Methylobacterium]MDR7038484.1 branched-chain amino acid transport system substrate-binding protein [Methylobacterium sp. BE186]
MKLTPAVLLALIAVAAPARAQAPASTPLKIGLAAPLTGPDAAFGQGLRLGAEQAVADLNRGGGRKLTLVVADDAGDPKQGAALARKFAAEGISLVVGPFASSVAALAQPAYEEAGIVMVTPGATWTPLSGRGAWNLFRLVPSDAQQAAFAGAYLADRYGSRRIGLVHDRTTFGRGLADEVGRTLKARGRREVLFESLPRGAKDAADLAAKLKRAAVEVVYFGGLAPEAALLIRAMREAGLDAPLVGSDGLLDKDFAQAAGPGAEGTVMTMEPEPRRLPEPRGGKAPARTPEAEAVAARAYAAVELLALGAARARSAQARKVAAALREDAPIRTLVGDLAFDAQGDARYPDLVLRTWRRAPDGRIDYLIAEGGP